MDKHTETCSWCGSILDHDDDAAVMCRDCQKTVGHMFDHERAPVEVEA